MKPDVLSIQWSGRRSNRRLQRNSSLSPNNPLLSLVNSGGFFLLPVLLRHLELLQETTHSVFGDAALKMITGPQWTETLARRESTGGRWGGKVAHVCMPECKYQCKTHVLAFGNRRKKTRKSNFCRVSSVLSVLPGFSSMILCLTE